MGRKGGKAHPHDPVVRAAFARVMVELRGKRGRKGYLSQEAVAAKSGYHEKYIGLLERRKNTPTLTAVLEIAFALNISPLSLVGRVRKLLPKFKHLERKVRDSQS